MRRSDALGAAFTDADSRFFDDFFILLAVALFGAAREDERESCTMNTYEAICTRRNITGSPITFVR